MEDERSGLINTVLQIIEDSEPGMVFMENTPRALDTSLRLILSKLEGAKWERWTSVTLTGGLPPLPISC